MTDSSSSAASEPIPSAGPFTVETREARPYLGIRRQITLSAFPEIADRMPGLFGLVAEAGGRPAGAPFFRYHAIGPGDRLDVEAGVPLAEPLPDARADAADGEARSGSLPAGRYLTALHQGHPDGLFALTERIRAWAATEGLEFDTATTGDGGERWAVNLESYRTDPSVEPDLTKWEVEVALLLRG